MKPDTEKLFIKDFSYELPHSKIAEFPLPKRDESKLLVYREGRILDKLFTQLSQQLPEGSTLVLNNTRVIEARILFQKSTGGMIEIFCLEPFQQSIEQSLQSQGSVKWQCLIGGASKWKPGQILEKNISIAGKEIQLVASYISKETDHFIIQFDWTSDVAFAEVLHAAGAIPLPPYIKRAAVEEDRERYQTVFSKREGSVAAPTAALHFTQESFQKLSEKYIDVAYVTLHVGAGTFKPVKSETIAGHEMHREPFSVSLQVLKNLLTSTNIIAVGTTSLRTLETIYWLGVKLIHGLVENDWTLYQWEAYDLREKYPAVSTAESLRALIDWMTSHGQRELQCSTSLIIVPGYRFNIPRALITNFHQPQSTLLLLVAAFIGDDWKKLYEHALNNDYRFLSYGDSSLLWRADAG